MKKIIFIKLAFVYFVIVMISGCEHIGVHSDDRLIIENKSNQKLYIIHTEFDSISNNLNIASCSVEDIGNNFESNSKAPYAIRGKKWESEFEKSSSGKFFFYVYDYDIAHYFSNNRNNCDSLYKRHDLILKRYDVTLDYLNQHNWTITYP